MAVGTLVGTIPTKPGFTYRYWPSPRGYPLPCPHPCPFCGLQLEPTPLCAQAKPALCPLHPVADLGPAADELPAGQGGPGRGRLLGPGGALQLPDLPHRGETWGALGY